MSQKYSDKDPCKSPQDVVENLMMHLTQEVLDSMTPQQREAVERTVRVLAGHVNGLNIQAVSVDARRNLVQGLVGTADMVRRTIGPLPPGPGVEHHCECCGRNVDQQRLDL